MESFFLYREETSSALNLRVGKDSYLNGNVKGSEKVTNVAIWKKPTFKGQKEKASYVSKREKKYIAHDHAECTVPITFLLIK